MGHLWLEFRPNLRTSIITRDVEMSTRHRTSGSIEHVLRTRRARAVSAPLTSYYPAAPLGALEGMLDAPMQEVSSDSFSSGS